ncbi:MAG: indolepyruvate oxidoreductase subunit beta [Candidatus Geothermincolia bacterium]
MHKRSHQSLREIALKENEEEIISTERTRSIVLAGVGGQGTILAANLLANALVEHGFDVKTSEVHGMAQRGGTVISMVRFGGAVASPLVPLGEAEALVATELLETLRNLEFLGEGGRVIASGTRVDPLPVLQGAQEYPSDVAERIVNLASNSVIVNAPDIAAQAGDARAANTVLLGILSTTLPVSDEEWMSTIEKLVKPRAVESNKKAFLVGRDIGLMEEDD